MRTLVLILLAAAVPSSATALQTPPSISSPTAVDPSPGLQLRAGQIVELINGRRSLADFFIPGIPADRFASNLARIQERFGAAISVSALEPETPDHGVVTVVLERGELRMRIGVTGEAPYAVNDFGPAR